ncbi:hypothetical protein HPC49_17525 [Pyxidicoccus fallax]|uniref:Uncharacterized protein n=1 Tax=Pyxidicoccus fallax TaxID=394095 RepID=A0A848LNT8_9BACT|nr:hypothetical protein [Pyxidicoccus fallax]NMO19322.1 hypothetical protein [Pyxidicoccus fallax]NPC80014.1 hypothetical protein [Pyxidicoccus fallax]
MGLPLTLASALWLATAPAGTCWRPEDQTAGWKYVDLPEEAPALAAPEDVDQLRSGEPARLSESDPRAYVGATKPKPGRMAYTFRVPPGTTRLEVSFLEPLRGAKVDATASTVGGGTFPLLSERRQAGASLTLEWYGDTVDGVVVEVHHHLRERPVVRAWRTERPVWPEREPSVTAAFRAPRALYFLHPGGGRTVLLCQSPERALRLTRWPLEGTPTPVSLKPVP